MTKLTPKERFHRIIDRFIREVDFQNRPIDYDSMSDRDVVMLVYANYQRDQEEHITDVGE